MRHERSFAKDKTYCCEGFLFLVLQYRQRIHLHKERAIPKFGCCKKREKYRHRMYPHTRNFGLGTDTILIRTKVRQRASSVPPNSLASLTFHEKANLVSFRKCIEMRMPVSFLSLSISWHFPKSYSFPVAVFSN